MFYIITPLLKIYLVTPQFMSCTVFVDSACRPATWVGWLRTYGDIQVYITVLGKRALIKKKNTSPINLIFYFTMYMYALNIWLIGQ